MAALPPGQLPLGFADLAEPSRPSRRAAPRAEADEELVQIHALVARGCSLDEIARALGLTRAQLRRRLKAAPAADKTPAEPAVAQPGLELPTPQRDDAPVEAPSSGEEERESDNSDDPSLAGSELRYEPVDDLPGDDWVDPV